MASEQELREYLKRATGALTSTRGRLRALEGTRREPIAIVGMSCRYPGGVASPEQLWELVADGRDGITPFPEDRGWDLERLIDLDSSRPGTTNASEGGFLKDPAGFDAGFFGIGPREALAMDPQQRLFLEATWEALEAGGLSPTSLPGTSTGVFAGVMSQDFVPSLKMTPREIEGYMATGRSLSVASGRIAYTLGLEGPALTVDTACSSSLVTIHLAAQALRGGECSLALAGGVTVLPTPRLFIEFSRQRGLSPDGRCKSFAEAADGTGWAEGVGVLVLERLSEAQRAGHQILAVVRGSAVNQDGASNGLTAPNGPSQERVIRQALANAGLSPQDIDAVEAHGTGTTLGDPIEAGALLATYGQGREQPLQLGSIKSNIGHTQAAAGVAGVIKMVEAMRHGVLPRTLHIDAPSTHVDWEAGQVELLSEPRSWEAKGRPRRAGVSSFGISGTNAHLILEQAPAPEPSPVTKERPKPPLAGTLALPLSAKSEPALREAAHNLAAHLTRNPDLDLADVGLSLTTTRSLFDRRAVVFGSEREQLLGALEALAQGSASPNLAQGAAKQGHLAYLLSGQGAQRVGMGKELYEASPPFAAALDQICEALDPHLGRPLRELLFAKQGSPQAQLLQKTTFTQPAMFSLGVALHHLLGELGLAPEYLAGHSVGEIAAAHISGVLSLPDACKLVCARGALMGELPQGGAMIAIEATEQEVAEAIRGKEAELSIAAINGPRAIVISGQQRAALGVQSHFEQRGQKTKRLAVSHAFHSPLMEPMLAEFEQLATGLSFKAPKIPIISTLSGELLSAEQATDPTYWVRQARRTVRFADAVKTLAEQGTETFLELGPDGVLCALAAASLPEASLASALRGERPEPQALLAALATTHIATAKVDWAALFPAAKRVGLPTYPFQRERFWLQSSSAPLDASAIGQAPADHPLLGAVVELPEGEGLLCTGRLSLQSHPWLADHALAETVLLPGTAFLELALHAADRIGLGSVEELTLGTALILPEQGSAQLQVWVGESDQLGTRPITISSRPEREGAEWTRHAEGTLAPASERAPEPLGAWPPKGAEPLVGPEGAYQRLSELGFDYGPAFQGLSAAWQRGEEVFAEVTLDPAHRSDAGRFGIHPALLDASFHAAIDVASSMGNTEADKVSLPFSWRGCQIFLAGASSLRVCLRLGEDSFGLAAYDQAGSLVVSVDSVAVRAVAQSELQARPNDSLFALEWIEVPPLQTNGSAPPRLATLGTTLLPGTDSHPDLGALLDSLAEGEAPELVLVELAAEQGGELTAAHAAAHSALSMLQDWLAEERLAASRLVLLTRGALAATKGEDPDPAQAPLWGLLRSAHSEHPGRFAVVDLDHAEASLTALPIALAAEEPQLALREGTVLAPRLVPVPTGSEESERFAIDPDATVLITGATGALGALFARHLLEVHGARHLLLVSRRGKEAQGAAELEAELEQLGAEVTITACDVGEREQVRSLLDSIPPERPLGAVIHAAGVLDDGTIEALDGERLDRVFRPKVDAAWHLHELTAELDLSAFVLFSSAAGLLGGPGQGNYAAANAFLDALAQHRRANGLAGQSLAWGLWEQESGMADEMGSAELTHFRQQIRARLGFLPMSSKRGLELFDAACALQAPIVSPVEFARAALRDQAGRETLPLLLSRLVRAPARRAGAGGTSMTKLAALPETERKKAVLDLVLSETAAVSGREASAAIEPSMAFKDLGFDSLAAVELRNRLNLATGLRLASTLVFDYPNPTALVDHLLAEATAGGGAVRAIVRDRASDEPIAIVGMSCRYPGGVASPEQLWELVADGRDGIAPFPEDRGWDLERLYDPDPDQPGTCYARHGGFLSGVADFDAEFFGISPREALAMDPQQRVLLEAGWEAFEHAGIDPTSLRGTETGVFAGIMHQDYASSSSSLSGELEGYLTGSGSSVASGRLAYVLGLEGPAVSVDTACSSSLVALHLACQALRAGECSLVLAGGVTVLSSPGFFTEYARQRVLSPDGRCKAFGATADGVGWAEGVGLTVVERLSDALQNDHQVLAVIRGSATNQDGASNGLTAPNGPSQERVIRQALASAGLSPQDIDAVEAHGTGTTLGDPIEAGALLATYGRERQNGPLLLGSLKSNIGHAIAAAGIGGVIKMAMALSREELPRTLHADELSPHVDWSAGGVELLTEPKPWRRGGRPRRAGISSFGISGTNAHMILEEAPEQAGNGGAGAPTESSGASSRARLLPGPTLLPLSAKTEPALRDAAARLAFQLEDNPELAATDVAYSLAASRTSFSRRAVVLGTGRKEILEALTALAQGKEAPNLARGIASGDRRPVFLFPGQGAQWQGMALDLAEHSAIFASHLQRCDEAISPHVDWSVRDVLAGVEGAPSIERIEVVQPALFAVMVSLARLWEECGVRPAAVAGHSQGEIAAAHLAGGLSLDDAAMLAAVRSQIISRLAGKGGLLSVSLPHDQLRARTKRWGGRIDIAAINGPSSAIFAGDREALDELLEQCAEEDVWAREVPGTVASHSAYVEELRDEVLERLAPIAPQSGEIPFYSTVTGELLDTAELNANYWYSNLRETVRFEQVTRSLLELGHRVLIEISPHPVFALALQETTDDVLPEPSEATVLSTLRREENGPKRFALSLAEAHAAGAELDWEAIFKGASPKRVPLPTYAFQRERFWLEAAAATGDATAMGLADPEHPLLGAAVDLAADGDGESLLLTGRLSLQSHSWLVDHAALDTVLLPGTAFLELALHAADRIGLGGVEELTLQAPLVFPEDGAAQLQVTIAEPDESERRRIAIYSRPAAGAEGETEWTRHATGCLAPPGDPGGVMAGSLVDEAWPPHGAEAIDVEFLYDRLAETGYSYGPAFQGLSAAWQRGEEVFAEVTLDPAHRSDAGRFGIHPALLDASFHAAIDVLGAKLGEGKLPLPFSFGGVRLYRPGAAALRVAIAPAGEGTLRVSALDAAGAPVIAIDALATRPIEQSQLADAARSATDSLFGIDWIEVTAPPGDAGPQQVAAVGEIDVPGVHRYAELDALAEAIEAQEEQIDTVLALVPSAEEDHTEAAVHTGVQRTLELLQGWLAEPRLTDVRLVIVTRGAVAVSEEEAPDPVQAAIWGLVRSAHSEHPDRFLLLDVEEDLELPRSALPALQEPQLALREGRLWAPRLGRIPAEQRHSPSPLDLDGTVLVTGGTGGLGGLVARHLAAAHGARHLLLVSRRGKEAEGAAELAVELKELGAEVEIAACDIVDLDALTTLIGSIPEERPLGAVIHAAGVIDDGTLESLTADQVERVLRPKVDATLHLHELTKELDLAAFVMFSSAAPLLGGPGQGNYAAANAFMDAFAQRCRAQGFPAQSLAWGLLTTTERSRVDDSSLPETDEEIRAGIGTLVGQVEDPVQFVERIRGRLGIAVLEPAKGLALLDAAMGVDRALLAPVRLDSPVLRAQAREGRLPALLRGLVRVPARHRQDRGLLSARLAQVAESERNEVVLEVVRSEVAAVLGHDSAQGIDAGRTFKELGFDSLTAVELRNRLNLATGLRLPSTLVFDYPTPVGVAELLRSLVQGVSETTRSVARRRAQVDEPIAIVGIACHYPGGVGSAEELWDLLAAGKDAISEFPTDRGWDAERLYDPDPDQPGTCYARHGGFLSGVADFDAEFFGISPREALAMDPQQRVLLEAGWEAFEHAGIDPTSLRGTETGVFAGIMHQDYASSSSLPGELEGYLSTGSGSSVASGRLAYVLGLEGPAVSVDTACSSSLVALHLACQALRAGECSLALAGGVTVLCSTDIFTEFARQRVLSPDGRCKAFGAAADGMACAEGVGLTVVERLSDALQNDHQVLAVIRGSATNQDGASNGLTAPNGPSQERVIRQALASAELQPTDVDAVEAHGTGTALGDPIEAHALLATYGAERSNGPLWLGSLKSNIGHTVAAAGIGGVIKMAMALRREELPRTLHADEPSPHVDWSAGNVELLTEPKPWPRGGRPRRAGISSFGISGTNAHMILEEAPAAAAEHGGDPAAPALPAIPWLISARSEPALRAQADRLRAHVEANPELEPEDVAFSLAMGRTRLVQRAAVVGSDRGALLAGLGALAGGERAKGVIRGVAGEGKTAFMFTGQGAQRAGMGAGLYESFPVFQDALDAACADLYPYLGRSLTDLLFAAKGSDQASLLDRTEFTQPALFALEVALYRLVESFGVRPDFLIGHSIGELVAAHVAGVLSLADASRLVAARGQLMGALPEGGAMLAVEASEEEIAASLGAFDGSVSIAAINGPRAVVVSGEVEVIDELEPRFAEAGRRTKRLSVSHAFHSPLMEPMLPKFREVAAGLTFRAPRIPIVSNVKGALVDGDELASPDYWVRQVRGAVRFADGVAALELAGVTSFLELGPDGVLTMLAERCLSAEAAEEVVLVQALRRKCPDAEAFIDFLATADIATAKLDWVALFPAAKRVGLPTYPFQRERFWLQSTATALDASAIGQAPADHPLLGAVVELPEGEGLLCTGRLSLQSHPWLADHALAETVLLPGTAFLELALHAADRIGLGSVEELTLGTALILPEQGSAQLQVWVGESDQLGTRPITISSRPEREGAEWTRHAEGTLAPASERAPEPLGAWPPKGAEPLVGPEGAYQRLSELGFDYGPAFQGLSAAWQRGEEVFAEVTLDPAHRSDAGRFGIHPALLDASFHAAIDVLGAKLGEGKLPLPFSFGGVRLYRPGAAALRVAIAPAGEGTLRVSALDAAGAPVIAIDALATRPIEQSQLADAARSATDSLFGIDWIEVTAPPGDAGPQQVAAVGEIDVPGVHRYAELDALAEAIEAQEEQIDTVLALVPSAEEDHTEAAVHTGVQRTLELLQGWLAEPRLTDVRLVIVTRGAVAVSEEEAPDPVQAAIWGLVRSAHSEHPDRFLLLDVEEDLELPRSALPALQEPQLALREGRLWAPRLGRIPAEQRHSPSPLDLDGTVLVTGGTGGLGGLVARHLAAAHGARHLLLVSRRGKEAEGAAELAVELKELGAEVEIAACDIVDLDALTTLIGSIPEERPLGAVIHAAGVIDDGTLESLTADQVERVLRPKVDATLHLHELTKELDLAAFVMFSSAAPLLGGPGQGNYAAANAFMDAFAQRCRAQGFPAQSLAWGPWAMERGMGAALDQANVARWSRAGVGVLSSVLGIELFDTARSVDRALLAPVRLDSPVLRAQAREGRLPALLRGLVRVPARHRQDRGLLSARLAQVAESERNEVVLEVVRSEVAAVLGHDSAQGIDAGRTFKELGFDSLTAVELRNRLNLATGLRLPSTLVFDYPTPVGVAETLVGSLSDTGSDGNGSSAEAEVWRVLKSISPSRLRESGLFNRLLELASLDDGRASGAEDSSPAVDTLDAEGLVRMSLEQEGSVEEREAGRA